MPPSSPPRRFSLLPPELDDIDAGWGEEAPTVVPTRAQSIPSRPPMISIAQLPDDEYSNRVTQIPKEPRDEFVRRVMAAAVHGDRPVAEAPPPPRLPQQPLPRLSKLPTLPAPGEALDLVNSESVDRPPREFDLADDDDDVFDRPTLDGARAPNPSEYPTAPPPGSGHESDRARTVPRVPRPRAGAFGEISHHDLPTDPPPSLAPVSVREPRHGLRHDGRAKIEQEPTSGLERARRAVTPVKRFGSSPSLEGQGLAFVGRLGSPAPPEPLGEMKDRFSMGDFSGALAVAEQILTKEPDEPEAKAVAAKCRDVLYDMYASRIAGMDREVSVKMGPDQLRWLSLDHRAGFLLAMIDGGSTVDELLDVSGMPRLDALRILCDLLDRKVIGLGR